MIKIANIQELGTLARKTRKAQGLSQEQLSAASGIGIRFIREFEQGKQSCQIGKVLTVLQMLGLDLCAAMRGEFYKS